MAMDIVKDVENIDSKIVIDARFNPNELQSQK